MADYELIGLNEAAPDLRAPTSADRGIIAGGVRVVGLAELDGGADINGDPVATVSRTNPLRQAVRVAMTAASSGSNGIQVLDNDNLDMGTNNFTLHWEGALPDYTPSATQFLINKYTSSATSGYGLQIIATTGVLSVSIPNGSGSPIDFLSTVATGLTDGSSAKISAVVTRETASTAGSVVFYVNGVQLGASVAITAAVPYDISNALPFFISGRAVARTASDTTNAIIYNRALSSAEVLSLCVNGPALADIGASQTPVYTSDFSAGVNGWVAGGNNTVTGNVDSINGSDDWLKVERISSTGGLSAGLSLTGRSLTRTTAITLFNPPGSPITHIRVGQSVDLVSLSSATIAVPAGTEVTTTITYVNNKTNAPLQLLSVDSSGAVATVAAGAVIYAKAITVRDVGITGQWSAQDAQSDTGQIFDSSGNKNHALLPAAGATIIGKEMSVPKQVRWTNTWAGTNELQYIGGVNQAILPAKAYIESIVGVITGATVEDIIIGDGSDTDRYVTITTGLAAGTTTFALANRTTDGTNLKLTVDPDANATMSIAWTITYRTLE